MKIDDIHHVQDFPIETRGTEYALFPNAQYAVFAIQNSEHEIMAAIPFEAAILRVLITQLQSSLQYMENGGDSSVLVPENFVPKTSKETLQ